MTEDSILVVVGAWLTVGFICGVFAGVVAKAKGYEVLAGLSAACCSGRSL